MKPGRMQVPIAGCMALFFLLGTAKAESCDPHARELSASSSLIGDGQDLDKAETIVDRVLAQDPADFHATYQKGLIIAQRADAADRVHWTPESSQRFWTGAALMMKAASSLATMDQACAKRKDFYKIYNVIAVELINRGHFDEASSFLEKADARREMLTHASYVKVLDNLGLVYLTQKKYPQAIDAYTKAASAGSKVAQYQLGTVEALEAINAVPPPSRRSKHTRAGCR
jgi:tetratricopeptide (TPR) repeat protein